MCYSTGGVLGHCVSAVGATGLCTCVLNWFINIKIYNLKWKIN
jgi:hypothetical protein